MKPFLPVFLLLISAVCFSQKYVLIDKNMALPLSYTNTVTVQNNHNNLFPVEKKLLPQFIAEVEKIGILLSDKKKPKPESIDLNIGQTRFVGLKVSLSAEERLDVVITTDCEGTKINMHLSDAKLSNANNAFFINTWIKYIKSYIK